MSKTSGGSKREAIDQPLTQPFLKGGWNGIHPKFMLLMEKENVTKSDEFWDYLA